eukprot:XP_001697644.1 predicted protein [Chlamydomonas reinhardtii]
MPDSSSIQGLTLSPGAAAAHDPDAAGGRSREAAHDDYSYDDDGRDGSHEYGHESSAETQEQDSQLDRDRALKRVLRSSNAAEGPLSLASFALGAAAAAAPPGLRLAIAGAVGDALTEHYNEQLRQLNDAGAAAQAPEAPVEAEEITRLKAELQTLSRTRATRDVSGRYSRLHSAATLAEVDKLDGNEEASVLALLVAAYGSVGRSILGTAGANLRVWAFLGSEIRERCTPQMVLALLRSDTLSLLAQICSALGTADGGDAAGPSTSSSSDIPRSAQVAIVGQVSCMLYSIVSTTDAEQSAALSGLAIALERSQLLEHLTGAILRVAAVLPPGVRGSGDPDAAWLRLRNAGQEPSEAFAPAALPVAGTPMAVCSAVVSAVTLVWQAAARLPGLWRDVLVPGMCKHATGVHGPCVGELLRLQVPAPPLAAGAPPPSAGASSYGTYSLHCALDAGLLPPLERVLRNEQAWAIGIPDGSDGGPSLEVSPDSAFFMLSEINGVLRYSGLWPAALAHAPPEQVLGLVATLAAAARWLLQHPPVLLRGRPLTGRLNYMKVGQVDAWEELYYNLAALLEQGLDLAEDAAAEGSAAAARAAREEAAVSVAGAPADSSGHNHRRRYLRLNDALEAPESAPMQWPWLVAAGGTPPAGSAAAQRDWLLSFAVVLDKALWDLSPLREVAARHGRSELVQLMDAASADVAVALANADAEAAAAGGEEGVGILVDASCSQLRRRLLRRRYRAAAEGAGGGATGCHPPCAWRLLSPYEVKQLVAAAIAPAALCANPRCSSLDGPSALVPPGGGKTCSRCRAARYCCGLCQLQHWREGGHDTQCPGVIAATVAAGSAVVVGSAAGVGASSAAEDGAA